MSENNIVLKIINGSIVFAPISFFNIPHDELPFYYNGCGSGKLGSKLTPDSLCGLSITYLCYIHDHMYINSCCELDEIIADAVLAANMIILTVLKSNPVMLLLRLSMAFKYMLAVSATTFSEVYWEENIKKIGCGSRYVEGYDKLWKK